MPNPKISVIVPIYNVEKHLEPCIKSILNQTFSNFELILVDDGSTDNSHSICNKFAETDDRITVIHQSNVGVSSARNTGLDIAHGDFICFVDSDDWLENTMLEKMYHTAIKQNTDVCVCGINIQLGDKSFIQQKFSNKTETYTQQQFFKIFPQFRANVELLFVMQCVWNKLIKRSILEKIRFDVHTKLAEDYMFCLDVFQNLAAISFLPDYFYNYRYVQTSAIRTSKIDFITSEINAIEKTKIFFIKNKLNPMKCFYQYKKERMYFLFTKSRSLNIDLPTKKLYMKTLAASLDFKTIFSKPLFHISTINLLKRKLKSFVC